MTYTPGGGTLADGAVTWAKLAAATQATIDGKASTTTAVVTTDPRLSDSRTPTAHTHTIANVTNLQTTLDGKAASTHPHAPSDITGTAVITTDPRLSDARPPTSHAYSSHTGLPTLGTAAAAATTDFVASTFAPTVSACPATTGTMTVTMGHGARTITPTGACTFNASGGVAGQVCTFAITTSGTSSFVLTFGTNFRKAGTLATGTTTARFFSVTFLCVSAGVWQEIARTAVLS